MLKDLLHKTNRIRLLFMLTMLVGSFNVARADDFISITRDTEVDTYDAALAAIQDGAYYRIFTEVDGQKYYVTVDGGLTNTTADGGIFSFTKVTGGAYKEYGYKIDSGSKRFTNPPLANNVANLTPGAFATTTNNRNDWEAQVLFMNAYNMFAIRSCNVIDGTSSWNDAGRTYWTFAVEEAVIPQYTYDQVYLWQIEDPLTTINVAYQLYESNGETMVGFSVIKKQLANSEVSVPAEITSNFAYDYVFEGEIGDADCTIKVIRTFKEGVVHDLADLSNDKAYTIRCDRGALLTKDGYLASTAHRSLTNAEATDFAVINYESNYYVYSVSDKKFVTNTGELAGIPTHGTDDAFIMEAKTDPYFFTYFSIEGSNNGLNTNGNDPYGYVINTWMTVDPGNLYYMIEASDFNPTEALAALKTYFHPPYVTYVVKETTGKTLFTSEPVETTLGATITTLPTDYQRPFTTYNEVDVTISKENTIVEFTATWNGPFELSANVANAKWYNMTIRSDYGVAMDESEPYYPAADKDLSTPECLWAFGGDAYNGIMVFNKAAGEGFTLTKDGNNAVMREGLYVWTIGSNDDGFTLKEPGTDYNCINQYGGSSGPLQFWNSASSPTDNGSTFRVSEDPFVILRKTLEEAVVTAREALERIGTDCTTAALGSLQEAIAKGEQEYDSNEKYEETIALVKNATSQAEEMSYYYLKCLRTRENIDEIRQVEGLEETVEGTFDALEAAETAANDDVIKAIMTVGEANEIIDNLRSALLTFLANIKPAQDHPVDISTLLENPDFEEGGEPMMGVLPGWTCTFIKNQTATNIGYMPNASNSNGVTSAVNNAYVNGDIRISHFMEAWQENKSPYMIGDGELYQRLSGLPIGKYRLVTDAIAVNQWYDSYNPVTGTYIYISSGQLETTTEIATGNGIPEHFEVDFINDHAESLDFGLKTINTTANWIAADNFRIYYVAALSESPGVAALKEALAGYDGVTFAACDAATLEAYKQELLHATEMTQTDIYSAAHSSECIDEIVTLKEAYDAVCSSEKDYEVYQQEVNKILNRYLQLQDKESPLAYSLNAYASTLELSINEGNAVASDFQYMDEKIAYIEYYWSRHLLPEDINTLENVLTQLGEQPAWSKRWDLDTDELILDGVINTEGRVTAISLADRGLIGVVPPALMTLQKVSAIDLSGNSFSAIESEVPASISLNLHNQQLNAIVDYKVGTNDASVILAQLPSILCYDSSAGGQTSHFVFSSTGDGWGFTLSEDNGNLRFTGNTPFIFKEENGAVLQCHSSFGNASGSTFSLRLTFDDGDANFNGEVNIGDLQMMINYIFDDIANGSLFNFTAADLWKDNRINVQDVVKEVDVLFAQSDDEAPVKAMYAQENHEDIHASLRFENGQLLLESDTPVTALDITLASDQSVSWQALQAMGFTVTTRNVSGGIRLIAYSMSGVEVPVGETAIATTTGSATVLKATLSDKTSNTIGVYLNSTIPTSINDIDEASLEGASVYDLGGRKVADKAAALRHLPKGIYVIDGKKVIK